MSILLDAVSRSKQQDEVLDPIGAPRPLYQSQAARTVPKVLMLPAALSIAVALAWGVNYWWAFEPSTAVTSSHVLANQELAPKTHQGAPLSNRENANALNPNALNPNALTPNAENTQPPGYRGELANGVRLAGKAALPTAVSSLEPPPAVENTATDLSFDSAQETPEAQAARMEALMAANVTGNVTGNDATSVTANITEEQQQVFNDVMAVEESRPLRTLTPTAPQSRTPEQSEGLSALKAEVDKAAADVGLARREPKPEAARSDKSSAPLTGDALVKAFEDALKEVEFDNATKREVSPESLSTIPKTSDFPRYGDLPAALQLQVPEFNIVAHVYSNDPTQRWLNVDGAELQEGDNIKGKLKIVEIRPRDVLLAVDGTTFKVPSI